MDDSDRGRAAHVLSRIHYERLIQPTNYSYYATRVNAGRRYSDEEVAQLLNLNVNEMIRVRDLYEWTINGWSDERYAEAIAGFLIKEKRWPTRKDFRNGNRIPNGLPSERMWRSRGEMGMRAWLGKRKNARRVGPQVILAIRNITLRAEAVETYGGYTEIIKRGGGTLRQQDDFGKLWELPPEPDIVEMVALFLEVVNATEVEGKREHFFLRVPPNMRTAREAVAWSFGLTSATLKQGFAAQT